MRFKLMVVFVLLVSACGGSSTEPESVDPVPVDTVAEEAPEVCPDAVNAVPERLPVGEVQELPNDGREHVICASYERTPPASGAHFPAWQNCGIYTQPIQNQTAVHSLEHGAVWVAYQPDLDASVLQAMTDQLKSEQFALAAPYPGLQNPIVLTAWTRQLAVDDWSDPAVEDFLDTYLGRYSPVAPEAGASCGQAVGSGPNNPNLHYQEILEHVS
ncbi:MAG: DUF3105 domain-containing protein [Acidimicrobiaceae bacterium]|nr:DUF3105 domain-containing protein [Acidimicrobiaceae bacterium]MXW62246.1 DUF3105 domain-containing protein [Acidimicrobiaceae bacterium]MXW77225.1 DUF3105 domain-containing protein [Acidimicrobiaceae bacterium]MYA73088.1 DUF3105 domain-containing protein [Acidimicrobiaceae bacterium]MYC42103.1 DUF3105 domain-containing protein [Acidimicrobiaceae bacterium]